ncbi:MutS protein msh5 [Allomyces arbusculus]|nr:MutS protein msh5 [Allomyces arbusculus]
MASPGPRPASATSAARARSRSATPRPTPRPPAVTTPLPYSATPPPIPLSLGSTPPPPLDPLHEGTTATGSSTASLVIAAVHHDNFRVGCAYFDVADRTLYLAETDLPDTAPQFDVVRNLKLQLAPAVTLTHSRVSDELAAVLHEPLSGERAEGSEGDGSAAVEVRPAHDFAAEPARRRLVNLAVRLLREPPRDDTASDVLVPAWWLDNAAQHAAARLAAVVDLDRAPLTLGCAGALIKYLDALAEMAACSSGGGMCETAGETGPLDPFHGSDHVDAPRTPTPLDDLITHRAMIPGGVATHGVRSSSSHARSVHDGSGGSQHSSWVPAVSASAHLVASYGNAAFQITSIRGFSPTAYLHLSPDTLESLQVFAVPGAPLCAGGRRAGTTPYACLYDVLNHTRTADGKWTLRQWMARPLATKHAIEGRFAAVATFLDPSNAAAVKQVRGFLVNVRAVPRILGRQVFSYMDWHLVAQFARAAETVLDTLPQLRAPAGLAADRDATALDRLLAMVSSEPDTSSSDTITSRSSMSPRAALRSVLDLITPVIDLDASRRQRRIVIHEGVDQELDDLRKQYADLEDLLGNVATDVAAQMPPPLAAHVHVLYFPQLGFLVAVSRTVLARYVRAVLASDATSDPMDVDPATYMDLSAAMYSGRGAAGSSASRPPTTVADLTLSNGTVHPHHATTTLHPTGTAAATGTDSTMTDVSDAEIARVLLPMHIDGVAGMDIQFRTPGNVYFKNAQMRALDAHVGDVHGLLADHEIEILHALRTHLKPVEHVLLQVHRHLVDLDCLMSLAEAAARFDYTRPVLVEGGVGLHAVRTRHPILELAVAAGVTAPSRARGRAGGAPAAATATPQAIPNDIELGSAGAPRLALLTGPNSSGKSVYLKMVGVIVYLAHLGSYVPAASGAQVPLTDKILTRVAARESVSRMESAFMIDLQQVSHAVRQATSRSLVLIDEFGKGTCTEDGIGLLVGVLHHFATMGDQAPLVLAATHYHEIHANKLLADALPIRYLTTRVFRNHDDELVFLYRVVEGRCVESLGGLCALLAGVPARVVNRGLEASHRFAQLERMDPLYGHAARHAVESRTRALVERFLYADLYDPKQLDALVADVTGMRNGDYLVRGSGAAAASESASCAAESRAEVGNARAGEEVPTTCTPDLQGMDLDGVYVVLDGMEWEEERTVATM